MSASRLPLLLTERARNDLLEIALYTREQWGDDQAARYNAALKLAFETLRDNPRLGRARDDLRAGLRCYLVEGHLVLYRIENETVVIQAIPHQRQDTRRVAREIDR